MNRYKRPSKDVALNYLSRRFRLRERFAAPRPCTADTPRRARRALTFRRMQRWRFSLRVLKPNLFGCQERAAYPWPAKRRAEPGEA